MNIRLVRDTISHDVVECLQELLALAEAGALTGLAFGATLRGKRFIVNTAGYAHENPTFTRGMLCALDDELRLAVQERADASPTL